MNLNELTIEKASQALSEGKIKSVDLVKSCLKEIEGKKNLNAFISMSEGALKLAQESDNQTKRRSKLDGVPLVVKDNILIEGQKCTAGSKILENFVAPYDATVISKLKKAGAIIIGKTNMDEFGLGSSTENSAYGVTKNPYDLKRVSGGSSGGSAAAVAANLCLGALGSDTGGSIRQPASFCGVVGFKPSYGAVSRYGLMAMASSLDQIGPLAKTVGDARILFSAIAGQDKKDATSIKIENNIKKNYRIGLIDYDTTGSDQSKDIYNLAVEKINKDLNLEKTDDLKDVLDYSLAIYYIIMPAEVSSNLARYDGIKYGLRVKGENLLDQYLKTRAAGFGDEAKRRIMLGTYVLSSGYYDAYYKKAKLAQNKIINEFVKIFKNFDVLILPTSPTLPFKIGEKTADPLAMYLSDIFTVPVNIAGLPAISLPCGYFGNLPVGLQVIGKWGDDEQLLGIAEQVEKILEIKK